MKFEINWKPMIGTDARFVGIITGSGLTMFAGQNDDGSFYWSDGRGAGKCSPPIGSYAGITDPKAYVAAAIARCKADAEAYARAELAKLPAELAAMSKSASEPPAYGEHF